MGTRFFTERRCGLPEEEPLASAFEFAEFLVPPLDFWDCADLLEVLTLAEPARIASGSLAFPVAARLGRTRPASADPLLEPLVWVLPLALLVLVELPPPNKNEAVRSLLLPPPDLLLD